MLINKEKLINKIATDVHYDTEHPLESYAKLLMMIVEAPDEEDVSHGEWIVHYNHNTPYMAHCSECGYIKAINSMNDLTEYCVFCGAKMDKVKDETN